MEKNCYFSCHSHIFIDENYISKLNQKQSEWFTAKHFIKF